MNRTKFISSAPHHHTMEALSAEQKLVAKLLFRACRDAENGDLSAVAWLITTGSEMSNCILEDSDVSVLRFCKKIVEKVEREELQSVWLTED